MTDFAHNPSFSKALSVNPPRPVWPTVQAVATAALLALSIWYGAEAVEWALGAAQDWIQDMGRWLTFWPQALRVH
ncbi:MAG: hypothetical protein ACYTG5_08740 [Planctomycetota bacterium]|jgi:hypothetical protein